MTAASVNSFTNRCQARSGSGPWAMMMSLPIRSRPCESVMCCQSSTVLRPSTSFIVGRRALKSRYVSSSKTARGSARHSSSKASVASWAAPPESIHPLRYTTSTGLSSETGCSFQVIVMAQFTLRRSAAARAAESTCRLNGSSSEVLRSPSAPPRYRA